MMGETNLLSQTLFGFLKLRGPSSLKVVEEVKYLRASQIGREVVLLSAVANSLKVKYLSRQGQLSVSNEVLLTVEANRA